MREGPKKLDQTPKAKNKTKFFRTPQESNKHSKKKQKPNHTNLATVPLSNSSTGQRKARKMTKSGSDKRPTWNKQARERKKKKMRKRRRGRERERDQERERERNIYIYIERERNRGI